MPLRQATEIALSLALAVVLGMGTKFIQLPYGGSVNLSPLPLIVVALRHGIKSGCIAGALYGVLDFILNPFFFHPVQVFIDYPLAFALLGLAGYGACREGEEGLVLRLRMACGIVLANVLRFVAHFSSGLVFFASFAPAGKPVWVYSLTYNASYIVPEMIIQILLIQTIVRILQRFHLSGPSTDQRSTDGEKAFDEQRAVEAEYRIVKEREQEEDG